MRYNGISALIDSKKYLVHPLHVRRATNQARSNVTNWGTQKKTQIVRSDQKFSISQSSEGTAGANQLSNIEGRKWEK